VSTPRPAGGQERIPLGASLTTILTSLLAGCAGTGHAPPATRPLDVSFAPNPTPSTGSRVPPRLESRDELETPEAYTDLGGSGATQRQAATPAPRSPDDEASVSLQGAEIREAADVILGQQLGVAYSVDPRVQGQVTLSTATPLGRDDLLAVFESALQGTGARLIERDPGTFAIVPEQGAQVPGQVVGLSGPPVRLKSGNGALAIKLHHVNAVAAAQFIGPMVSQQDAIRIDAARNLLLVVGSRAERESVLGVLADIDAEWLADKAVGLFPLRVASPDDILPELAHVFGSQETGQTAENGVRIVPVRRLHAIMVVTDDRNALRAVGRLVHRLDRGIDGGRRLYVRELDHAAAPEVAKLLAGIYGKPATISGGAQAPAGPATLAPQQGGQQQASPALAGESTARPLLRLIADEQPAPAPQPPQDDQEGSGPSGPLQVADDPGVQVAADTASNLLFVRASPQDYRGMEELLDAVDAAPPQVLVEATVIEVDLNDSLRYGVQYFLQSHGARAAFSSGAGNTVIRPRQTIGAPLAVVPGLNLILGNGGSTLAIDALSQLTNVRVLSSPSVLVEDGRDATLKVGDSVPVETQSAQGVLTPGSPIVNSIEYRDTGVILKVRPRIGRDGTVAMDIGQEVSRVAPSATSDENILAPTITQRLVTSRLDVQDGQSIAIGGMIGQEDRRERARVPILGSIPFIGALFGATSNSRQRTELVVILTPHIVRDPAAAQAASEELRDQLGLMRDERGVDDLDRPRRPRASVPRRLEPAVYEPQRRRGSLLRLLSRKPAPPPRMAPTLADMKRMAPEPDADGQLELPLGDTALMDRARRAKVPEEWWPEMMGIGR
jgi:general secretion pathway protein D